MGKSPSNCPLVSGWLVGARIGETIAGLFVVPTVHAARPLSTARIQPVAQLNAVDSIIPHESVPIYTDRANRPPRPVAQLPARAGRRRRWPGRPAKAAAVATAGHFYRERRECPEYRHPAPTDYAGARFPRSRHTRCVLSLVPGRHLPAAQSLSAVIWHGRSSSVMATTTQHLSP